MAREITIDGSGRLVIPKEVREAHHLDAGVRLVLFEEDDRLVLVRQDREPSLVERDGLLIVAGTSTDAVPDHRTLREERLDSLARSE